MKFNISRGTLLPILQMVSTVADRRQQLPILTHLLFRLEPGSLTIIAADLEVELIVNIDINLEQTGEFTLPARKMFDICNQLPSESTLQFEIKDDKGLISSGKSRFTLACLAVTEYPIIEIKDETTTFKIKQSVLERALENTQFAMAQQDVRYYLNGLLFDIQESSLKVVATDGHRLALDEVDIVAPVKESLKIIVPRKGVAELMKLLKEADQEIEIEVSHNHLRVKNNEFCFTSKLIDGNFPEYLRVIPDFSETPAICARDDLKNSLMRASILSNEKYRGVRMIFTQNNLQAFADNPEQERAEEELEIEYAGEKIEIGFNVSYLLDVLSTIKSDKIKLSVLDPNSSCLILPEKDSRCQYVIMPMRL